MTRTTARLGRVGRRRCWPTHVPAALLAAVALIGCGSSHTSSSTSSTAGSSASTTAPASTVVTSTAATAGTGTGTGTDTTATTGASAPAAGDGCQYVTAAQVSAAVGVPMTAKPVAPRPPFNAPACLYQSNGIPVRQINVQVLSAAEIATIPGQTARSYFDAAKAHLANVQPLTGFGDDAFAAGTGGTVVEALKGSTIVTVTGGVGGVSAQAVAATRSLMAIVLTHV